MDDDAAQRPALPSQYRPAEVEGPLYEQWVERGYFTADPKSGKPHFSLVIPPPNVTGSLHIGHALEQSMMDAVTRRARMRGFDTLWLPGMDHASIAVHALVERHLTETEGKGRFDYPRDEFVAKAWEWKERYGGQILGQMRRLGDGVDWSRERFTMDDGLSRAVQTIFKRLYDDELIYRAERIINWCPRDLTALSDAEVDHEEEPGELISIRYGEGDTSIVVATTRAETMLGDTAVAVHPDDERYRHLIGADVALPLTNRRIPILADEHVDPTFGTGAVKVTPAHDPNDFEIGRRHNLPSLTILDERGVITAPGPFAGLDRMEARYAIVQALREDGRIVAEKRPYLHAVGHCSRCATLVEPRLSLQWWVRVESLAKAAGDAVRDGRVAIEPESMRDRYFQWVDNLRDWCISRQLWWGHRIPVWYSPDGDEECFGPDDTPPSGWTQDDDVLDTWFSSALWPFSTFGWPEDTEDLRTYYPTTVLITGYDILFFWVVRMMLFGLYAMKNKEASRAVPFRTVVLHGLVRDSSGKKMSKSRGNVVDPLLWIDAYGADAVRLSLLQGANPGADQAINEEWVVGTRNFCNKLWNATRFALLSGATVDGELPSAPTGPDAWILSRLHAVTAQVDALYERYEFAKIADLLYHFAWDEVCDWYIELAKLRLGNETRRVLGEVLDTLLRLLHPMIPFVTEALWTALTGRESVVVADWPAPVPAWANPAAEAEIRSLQQVVTEVRRFRSEQGVKPSYRIPARVEGPVDAAAVRALSRLAEPGDGFAGTASVQVSAEVTIAFDLSGAIDVSAERARLTKDRAAAEKERDVNAGKLANPSFTGRAPEPVVAKVRERLTAAEADLARIDAALAALPGV